ncbi:MAG: hypothetical protein U9N02_07005 [Campylobacterota bacterium]|nr:hypothetical protein [Campylobacterota bacterium]
MKLLFSIFILISLLNGDEIQRIEEIISDITKLRSDYKKCQKDLKNRFVKTDYNELEKYKILLKKEKEKNNKLLAEHKKMLVDMKWYTDTIGSLEEKLKEKVVKSEIVNIEKNIESKTVFFKAGTFRLISSSNIYDKINGKKIDNWEKHRTFTSNIKSNDWIKITGYFINKKWHKAQNEKWIKLNKVIRRN